MVADTIVFYLLPCRRSYSGDNCWAEITPGQKEHLQMVTFTYRPQLYNNTLVK